ncbi:MAG: ice-binding family protein [Parcubacteria group bacterium]
MTAGNFVVLGGSTVTNTGSSVLTGDLGVSAGSAITGFPPGTTSGTTHSNDAVAIQAQVDLTAAYTNASGQACDHNLTGQDLGGKIITPGVYCFDSSAQLTGTLTLDGGGDLDAVFIFKMGSTLTTASGSKVSLINSAQSCHVFWQVGSSATLGTTTNFKGNILALTSITMNTGATIKNGRALARNGAVTLDANTITKAICATSSDEIVNETEDTSSDIKVKKTASDYKLNSGPKKVTFTYKVTNEGDIALSDISVKDDKCDDVSYVSGDKNDDELLDTTEEWKYECTKKVKKTETNTVTAKGTANGERIKDTDKATVTVSTPSLPNAGANPDEVDNSSLWMQIISWFSF